MPSRRRSRPSWGNPSPRRPPVLPSASRSHPARSCFERAPSSGSPGSCSASDRSSKRAECSRSGRPRTASPGSRATQRAGSGSDSPSEPLPLPLGREAGYDPDAKVTLVPHTHWDREWYEPFEVFVERLVQMMDTLLDLAAEGFPHFHLDGQTAMIDDYLERRPERTWEIEQHVRAGRLSAGPWVTQMDEFLTSGESHIRNLEMGMRRAEALGGVLPLGYMP